MEWHGLDRMQDYQAHSEARDHFSATGNCPCDDWMYRRVGDSFECQVCGRIITEAEFDERFPIPF